jgi:2-oxoacid:acceptor oxidoreductase gamma subunit (pyruvate/2-ketoisovalerate family)
MSGQGSVQAGEVLSKVHSQMGMYVSVNVYPGTRARSAPVINYVKISDSPGLASCANYHPSEVIIFQEELLNAARHNSHDLVADAVARMREGTLLVNSPKSPEEIDLPFAFRGVVATVDATEICQRLLGRNPPPVGLCLLGAYARITESIDLTQLRAEVRDALPGSVGDANARAVVEAYQSVKAIGGVKVESPNTAAGFRRVQVDDLTQHYRFDRYEELPGYRKGSPFVWRDSIPVCIDSKCICPGSCISEVMCPDGTGFIVREGLAQQGYRIDVDFCRGCGICAAVCVGSALTMVDEDRVLNERPGYEEITMGPHLAEIYGKGRYTMDEADDDLE